jgi:hypothetical protein
MEEPAHNATCNLHQNRKPTTFWEEFFPLWPKIQEAEASDEDTKRMAKQWLRSKLSDLRSDGEKPLA